MPATPFVPAAGVDGKKLLKLARVQQRQVLLDRSGAEPKWLKTLLSIPSLACTANPTFMIFIHS
jgi:hypothetical protein